MIKEIADRRSIRKYSEREISDEDIKDIIESGILAPSAKNRQPWKFIVVKGRQKEEMLDVFRRGIMREETEDALLINSRQHLAAAKYTIKIMEQAPVSIFVMDAQGKGLFTPLNEEDRIYEIVNVQSIGAAIQNILLDATEKGMGSLWICDIFFAYQELCEWLGEEGDLLAAVALGYPQEAPHARPRKRMEDVIVWKE